MMKRQTCNCFALRAYILYNMLDAKIYRRCFNNYFNRGSKLIYMPHERSPLFITGAPSFIAPA